LIASGGFHIWNPDETEETENFSGSAALGGDWLVLSTYWINNFFEATLDSNGVNLDAMITHEIDHHLGSETHVANTGGWHTTNSVACAPEQSGGP
jgi:hypothetical protein